MQKKKPMRETDKLVFQIALCTITPFDSIKSMEAKIRTTVHNNALRNGTSPLAILRDMWTNLTSGHAHRRMNEMIAKGYMEPLSFDEFDARKELYKTFQYRARHLEQTKAKARAEGLIK